MSVHRVACLALLAACGRVGFAAQRDGGTAASDGAPAKIAWLGSFAQYPGLLDFEFTPHGVGNALVLYVECNSSTPATVSVTSPTVTFVPLSPVFGSTSPGRWAASFGAIATGEVVTQVNVSWSVSCSAAVEIGDEFANTDPTGGTVTFDNHAENEASSGSCTVAIVTGNADDAVWAACVGGGGPTGVSAGYTKAADDGTGDWTAYDVTDDAAGTTETPAFYGLSSFVTSAVTLKPRG